MNIYNKKFGRRAILPTLILTALSGCGDDKAEKNLPPTITGTAVETVYEGQEYRFAPKLFDYEMSSLTVTSSVTLPSWLNLDSRTGVLSGTPGYGDAASIDNIVLTVSDGENKTSLDAFDLTVVDVNRVPIINISSEQNRAVISGNVFEFNVGDSYKEIATDPDGQPIIYSAFGLPDWAHFNSETGAITSYDPLTYDKNNITAEDTVVTEQLNEVFSVSIYASDGISSNIFAQKVTLVAYQEVVVNGTVITDKPVAEAMVYFDTNRNERWDFREPKATTNSAGEFSFVVQGKDAMAYPRSRLRADLSQGSIDLPNSATFAEAEVTLLSMPSIDMDIVDGVVTQQVIISPYTDYVGRTIESDTPHFTSYLYGSTTHDGIRKVISDFVGEWLVELDEVYAYEHKGSKDLASIGTAFMGNYLTDPSLSITESALILNEARYLTALRQVDTDTRDSDGDGVVNHDDDDADNDGVKSNKDQLPLDPTDSNDFDRDSIGDLTDTDDDNDGVLDVDDEYPLNPKRNVADSDNDKYSDDDELLNGSDPFDAESVPANDFDKDFISDLSDLDDDNDGVEDTSDAFPFDATETVDFDLDGIGDNADLDDDNDGVNDTEDAFPFNDEAYATYMFNVDAMPNTYQACFSDYTDGDSPVLSCINGAGELESGMTYNFLAETDIPYAHDAQIAYNFFAGECLLEGDLIRCYSGDLYAEGSDDFPGWGTREPAVSQPYLLNVAQARLCFADLSGVNCLGSDEITDKYRRLNMNSVKYIGSGEQHTCALNATEVRCRGSESAPYNLDELPDHLSFTNPVDMHTSTSHTCVVDENGLQCWGKPNFFSYCNDLDGSGNEYSQRCWGDDNFFDEDGYIYEDEIDRPVKSIELEDVTAFDMSYKGGCIANQERGLQCYGFGFDTPIVGVSIAAPEPVFYTIPTLTNVTDVAYAGVDICALSDEGVSCFGHEATVVPDLGEVYDLISNQIAICAQAEKGTYCITETYTGFVTDLIVE